MSSMTIMSSITIHGRHALLFDDDANAAFVNSREALVPFGGDDSCLIDRYDARHLLDRIPPRPINKNKKYVEDTAGIDQADLDRERFLDLPLDEDDDLPENDDIERGDTERPETKSSSSYQAVGFSYRNSEDSSDLKNPESNDSVFSPPFAVPTDLLYNLMLAAEKKLLQKPRTEKLHQIMARTAIFVSEHGGQSEIVLRVKQGGNPTFGFLMPDNQLHPYFRYLVKHPQLLRHGDTLEKKNSDNGGALSLLGSMYGTGEDDENANNDDSKDECEKTGKEEPPFEKEPIVQHAVVTSSKERSMVPKKSHLIAPSSTGRKKDSTTAKIGKKADAKPVILEPPTFLKGNIDKAVEFIQKNGRKFEAKLIEQDKTIGRFPFLLATNQYHSYYLKVLEEALESKSSDPTTKRKSEERGRYETVPDELVDDLPFNPHKKEKFTMLLGNTRREIVDQPSKPVQQSGVTADEAAMIVLAATRGQSPFPSTSTNDSDSRNLSLNKEKTSEVTSNEATMTKEQKIKAERLKRAKMFAAMIKSGAQPIPPANESKSEESNHAPINEPKHAEVNAAEPKLEEFDEASVKERNYRKKNIEEEEEEESDDERKHSTKKPHSEDKESKHRHRHSHRRHKHNHDYDDDDDEDEESKNRRRRHHRHRSHRKYSDSDSEDDYKEARHRRRSHRKYSDSEDEDKHEKSSRHRRRHSKRDLSEEDDRDGLHKHRRKHRSPLEKEDLEEGELCDAANAASVKSSDHTATEVPSDLRAKIRAMLLETL